MNLFRSFLLAAVVAQTGWPANLALSTYLKDGFTPAAITSDALGNVYIAGSAVIDPASQTNGAIVAKLDPKATQYLYLAYLDSAANDHVAAIAIDGSGNAYVAGWTTNPNFPVVGGGALATAPTSGGDLRSFVTKLNPQGAVVFSVLLGGSAMSTARGIALTPQGQILVSGIAASKGFPTTAGAYNVADSTSHWFLMELDVAASKMIFPPPESAAVPSRWMRPAISIWPAAALERTTLLLRAHIKPRLFKVTIASVCVRSVLTAVCNTSPRSTRRRRS